MKIKVLLFGVLAEKAGKEEMEVEKVSSLEGLKKHIIEQYPSFEDYKFNISLNQTLVKGDIKLQDGDEVALLPPFAGG
ncbi:MAG: MoaD/ThiS family protein [Bacteroidales bacterium]|nr:MoaD/ThiS family protein [Bacteroidales bacterium]